MTIPIRRPFAFRRDKNGRGEVLLGDLDISRYVSAIRIADSAVESVADVELTLRPDAFVFEGDAVVDVNAWAAGLLIDLGWAPPAVDE